MKTKDKFQFSDDVNWFIPSEDRTEAWKLEALGKTIYVSKEMKQQLIRDEWREWKQMTNAERCDIASKYEGKMKKCRGNCSECEHTRQHIRKSFEEYEEEVNEGKRDPSAYIEACNENNPAARLDTETPTYDLSILHSFIDSLDKVGKHIMKLLCEDCEMSLSEIASKVGISKPSVGKRIQKYKKVLKEKYKK